jgi:hypothetical protein
MYKVTRALVVRALAVILVGIGGTGAARAQQPSQAQINAIRQNCRADYQSYCASVPPGGSASLECLKQNASSLSPACQGAVAAVGGPAPMQGTAPAPTGPATTRPAPPTRAAPPPLTPRQELGLLRRACGADFRAYCAGTPPGGGRIISCLEANSLYLSRQCRSALVTARQRG